MSFVDLCRAATVVAMRSEYPAAGIDPDADTDSDPGGEKQNRALSPSKGAPSFELTPP